ncbi:DNA repair protein RadC [Indibacter alkaliphilus LW1]|uniref:DNA repair protein RadC n=1 Tax=Indibacter alkaliphilus (strain CCUG 57479 / KCTC 22604 / LW1) TaxID=1189612 RepID=S2DLP1_INDAL|nr:JAB domain-containing protein [Indibacter alkaliphilus]EPA00020.1 DNA repair protein RadC [Indibacter alkaliphilus LW1]
MTNLIFELQLSYKAKGSGKNLQKIRSSVDAFQLLQTIFDPDLIAAREEFIVLYLNRDSCVIGYHKAFQGGVSSVVCDPKIILGVALKSLASGLILAHNHPSGKLIPSEADLSMTRRIKNACKEMEIELMDHLILSPDGQYFSFADEGKI